jgi:hypothetical protein
MSSADQTILKALADAQAALARYIEPGGPGEAGTINALLGILDNEPLIRAQDRAGPLPKPPELTPEPASKAEPKGV